MDIPLFYLRYPWSVVLKYTRARLPEIIGEYALKSLNDDDPEDVIGDTEVGRVQFSDQEKHFKKSLGIEYSELFEIRKRKGDLCVVIPNFWHTKAEILGDKNMINAHKAYFLKPPAKKRSGLQADINGPLTDTHTLLGPEKVISSQKALYICELAKFVCKGARDKIEKIQLIINTIQEKTTSASLGNYNKTKKRQVDRIEKKDKVPASFNNTTWCCYERTDSNFNPEAKWGIAIARVTIGESGIDGYTAMSLETRYNLRSIRSVGKIFYDPISKYLIGQVTRLQDDNGDLPETLSIFIMKVRDPTNQMLSMGHYCNYSIHRDVYLVKNVIWHKSTGDFEPQDLVNTQGEFQSIDINIRRFLYHRANNRLTAPNKTLTELIGRDKDRALSAWLQTYTKNIIDDLKTHACIGKYYVCYYYGEEKVFHHEIVAQKYISKRIRVDELEITYDDDAVKFEATFLHRLTNQRGQTKNRSNAYIGKISRKDNSLQIFLENNLDEAHQIRSIPAEGNFVLFSFNLPICHESQAENIFEDVDFFEGTVSGLSDNTYDPLCFRALLIKKKFGEDGNILNPIAFKTKKPGSLPDKIIQYFYKNFFQSQIRIHRDQNTSWVEEWES